MFDVVVISLPQSSDTVDINELSQLSVNNWLKPVIITFFVGVTAISLAISVVAPLILYLLTWFWEPETEL